MPSRYDDDSGGSSSSSSSDSEDDVPTQTLAEEDSGNQTLSLLDDVNELILPPTSFDDDAGEADSGRIESGVKFKQPPESDSIFYFSNLIVL